MTSEKPLEQSSSDNDMALQNIPYEEDEYGYVDTRGKISKELISQLPSRHFDFIDAGPVLGETTDRSIRRRQSNYRTLQLKNATLTSRQVSADVDKIYELLNSDPDAKEEDKLKTLREMHQSLTIKRQVKERLDADMEKRRADKVLDKITRFKLRTHSMMHKFLYGLKNMRYSVELWHSQIKAIQGQFGSGVASYFIFLRWLLYLNLSNFTVVFFPLWMPQLAYQFTDQYNTTVVHDSFSGYDLITGSGWFSNSSLYFGRYSHEVIELIPGLPYSMPLAYLFVVGTIAIINLIAVSYSLTSSYQKNYIDTAGDVKHKFCNKVFSAWDYSIETEDAAKLRKIAFCNEIKELLSFIRREQRKRTLTEQIIQKSVMVIIYVLYLSIAAGISYGVYYLVEQKALQVDVRILQDMTLSLTVTLVSTTSYFFMKIITRLEFYLSKKKRLYLTMARAVLLRTAMSGIIVYFWMIASSPVDQQNQLWCHETELGKEIYRLILVNFVMNVIFFTFFGEFVRKLMSSYVFRSLKLSEFDVGYNTLDLIYLQTLVWVGTFCMPLAPLINIILLVLLFYIKSHSIASNCRPPKRTWSVNEAQTFFLTLMLVLYLATAFAVGYSLFALEPSACGPFQDYKNTADLIHNIFFEKGEEHEASEVVKYISSPGVMFAFFCALCVVVYYMRAQAKAHMSVVTIIREQLAMEGQDKVFLLQLYDKAVMMHSQNNANGKDGANLDSPSRKDPGQDNNSQDVFNEGYNEYFHPVQSPPHHPKTFGPGYTPANVPVNKQCFNGGVYGSPPRGEEAKGYSPVSCAVDVESPVRKAVGIHLPSHQPGFRNFFKDDSPRPASGAKEFYERNS